MTRLLFFWADFFVYLAIIALVIVLRHGDLSLLFFYYNCEILVPLFLLISVLLWVFSFYDLRLLKKWQITYANLIISFIFSFLAAAAFIYYMASILNIATPKTILLGVFILYYCYIYLSRKLYSLITFHKTDILVFGKSNTLNELLKEFKYSKHYNVVACYENVENITYPQNIDLVLVSSKLFSQNKDAWNIISHKFLLKGYLLTTDLLMFEDVFKRISKEGIKDNMWLLRGIAARRIHNTYPIIKRGIDIMFSLCLLPIFILPMFFIYFLIKITDGFDPIFLQERVGQKENKIYVYKFRTMIPNTENITKLGVTLRRFRLDEIPQIINILKGDISIVGPRPLYYNEYNFLNKYVPSHSVRSIVKPGLTGWAQLNFKAPPTYCVQNIDLGNKPTDEIFDAAFNRLAYDVWYIKNRSLSLDIEILLKTAKRAFIKDSAIKE
ncbi:MAG: sugar transferase [Elusimicrobiaceae bacterium]|nr:sugar transferase [Elusimicrobiaceae bacterium]